MAVPTADCIAWSMLTVPVVRTFLWESGCKDRSVLGKSVVSLVTVAVLAVVILFRPTQYRYSTVPVPVCSIAAIPANTGLYRTLMALSPANPMHRPVDGADK